jgi:hypothetical protein
MLLAFSKIDYLNFDQQTLDLPVNRRHHSRTLQRNGLSQICCEPIFFQPLSFVVAHLNNADGRFHEDDNKLGGELLPLRDVHAEFLHQPRGQKLVRLAPPGSGTSEVRAAQAIRTAGALNPLVTPLRSRIAPSIGFSQS